MAIKITIIVILLVSLLSCDGDLGRGNCDEGFFEQTDFEGRSYCLPLTDETGFENTNTENLIKPQ